MIKKCKLCKMEFNSVLKSQIYCRIECLRFMETHKTAHFTERGALLNIGIKVIDTGLLTTGYAQLKEQYRGA